MTDPASATLRAAGPGDISTVVGWPTSAIETEQWCGATSPVEPATMRHWWADTDVRPWVLADPAGRLVGYGELWLDTEEDEVELARLIVAPEHRGQGWGRRLVDALAERARATGLAIVTLRVVPDNDVAIRTYAAAGFVRVDPADEAAWNQHQPRAYRWMTLGGR